MNKQDIIEYMGRYSDDANLIILIANIKDRIRYGIKEFGFLEDEEITYPVLCIEVKDGEDMDEFMQKACEECKTADHNGKSTEMVRTNADRIRNMTDEELAEWIAEIHACVSDDKICYLGKTCEVCTLEWLKQEVGCE